MKEPNYFNWTAPEYCILKEREVCIGPIYIHWVTRYEGRWLCSTPVLLVTGGNETGSASGDERHPMLCATRLCYG